MRHLTDEGQRALSDIAARHGVSMDAVQHLLMAVAAGGTTQAQFNHPELGGMGQWSQGGMIMVGDMFNNGLKARVDALCNEVANLVRGSDVFQPPSQSQYQGGGVSLFVPGGYASGNWWPEELGHASSTGSQNNLRYAFFPQTRRLAIDLGGRIRVYDTRDHQIGGFSQQQGGGQSLSFNSQYGLVDLSSLEEIAAAQPAAATNHTSEQRSAAEETPLPPVPPAPRIPASDDDIIGKIERLAGLHARGILTDEEFQAKKAELLSRL